MNWYSLLNAPENIFVTSLPGVDKNVSVHGKSVRRMRQSIVASTAYERIKTVLLFVQNIYNLKNKLK